MNPLPGVDVRPPLTVDDFRPGDVYQLGTVTLSREDIVDFGQRYDPQPRHLHDGDPSGLLIASGWHLAAVYMRLYVDAVLRHTAVEVSPGVDELRWLQPVRPGEALAGTLTIVGVQPSLSRPDCGILRQRGALLDVGERPVMRVTLYSLVRKWI